VLPALIVSSLPVFSQQFRIESATALNTFGQIAFAGRAAGSDDNGNQLHGLQVSLSTQGFNFPLDANAGFVINLAQNASIVIRTPWFGNKTVEAPDFRYFNFNYYSAKFTTAENNITGDTGAASFEARSPANSKWQLSINTNDGALLNNLGRLLDMHLQFGIRRYIDQTAAQAGSSQ
jgi:hypothetical protein